MKNKMKTVMSAAVLAAICLGMCLSFVNALDKVVYPGCEVVDQRGDTLYIHLNKEITSGTDTACLKAIELIRAIAEDGYNIIITNEGWTPVSKKHFTQPITKVQTKAFFAMDP